MLFAPQEVAEGRKKNKRKKKRHQVYFDESTNNGRTNAGSCNDSHLFDDEEVTMKPQ